MYTMTFQDRRTSEQHFPNLHDHLTLLTRISSVEQCSTEHTLERKHSHFIFFLVSYLLKYKIARNFSQKRNFFHINVNICKPFRGCLFQLEDNMTPNLLRPDHLHILFPKGQHEYLIIRTESEPFKFHRSQILLCFGYRYLLQQMEVLPLLVWQYSFFVLWDSQNKKQTSAMSNFTVYLIILNPKQNFVPD